MVLRERERERERESLSLSLSLSLQRFPFHISRIIVFFFQTFQEHLSAFVALSLTIKLLLSPFCINTQRSSFLVKLLCNILFCSKYSRLFFGRFFFYEEEPGQNFIHRLDRRQYISNYFLEKQDFHNLTYCLHLFYFVTPQ